MGIIFIIIGSLLSLIIITSIPNTISNIVFLLKSDSLGYALGHTIGGLIPVFSMAIIVFFLFRFGLKWKKK